MIIGNLTFRNALKNAVIMDIDNDQLFDFSSTKLYDPFAMLFMASTIKENLNKKHNVKGVLRYKPSVSSISYAGHMGFFKSISENIAIGKMPGEARGSNSYLPVTKIDIKNDFNGCNNIEEAIESKSIELAKVLTQEKELYKVFAYVIREMLRNSIEHSNENCVWICAQYWPSKSLTEIAILDNGIGIRKSLTKNIHYKYDINNDETALKMSLLPGITESFGIKQDDSIWSNSGFGLYIASHLCQELNGSFLIASDSKALYLCDGKEEIINTNHKGTAIRMTIKTNKKIEYDKIIKKIRDEGISLSKEINKSVKKPSKSSSGLVKYM